MKKKTKKFDWRKFYVKGITRLAYRAVEIAILFALFYGVGLRLPRVV